MFDIIFGLIYHTNVCVWQCYSLIMDLNAEYDYENSNNNADYDICLKQALINS